MGGGSELQRLSGGENCVLGMVTGVMAKACNYPFLVWKNTVQQGLQISLNPRIVYRGLPMACLNLGGTNAVQFGGTGALQKVLATAGSSPDTVMVGGAFLGGAASGLPCSIWELCMIQQQRFGGTALGTPARFVREYGAAALGRGVTMTIGREAMFTMSMLGITPLIQQRLVESSGVEANTALAVGALSGAIFAGTITHPMDTIKTCMQVCTGAACVHMHGMCTACARHVHGAMQGDLAHTMHVPSPMYTCMCVQGDLAQLKYQGIMQTGRSLAAEYGVMQGLFKGLSCALPRPPRTAAPHSRAADAFHTEYVRRACAMRVPCVRPACAVRVPCMCRVCAVHVPCTHHARALLADRIALISTTFFLVNSFKQRLVPALFPHAVAGDKDKPRAVRS